MRWLNKIFGRDNAEERLADAHLQRVDAARDLHASREVVRRVHHHGERNHFGDRFQAAFYADDRRRRNV